MSTFSGLLVSMTGALAHDVYGRMLRPKSTPEQRTAAVALRKMSTGWSLFVGAPGLTSDLLRIAARKAGVHLYTETDCNIYANGPIVALHAAHDGPVMLDTGHRSPVHDALTGDFVADGPRITLVMKKATPACCAKHRLEVAGRKIELDNSDLPATNAPLPRNRFRLRHQRVRSPVEAGNTGAW